jgi:hypothetical protein
LMLARRRRPAKRPHCCPMGNRRSDAGAVSHARSRPVAMGESGRCRRDQCGWFGAPVRWPISDAAPDAMCSLGAFPAFEPKRSLSLGRVRRHRRSHWRGANVARYSPVTPAALIGPAHLSISLETN